MKETAQRIFARMSLVARYLVLRRQLAEVVRVIETLNTPDRRLLHAHACRELDISARESRDAGTTNAAFARARSDNSRLRVLGIGQWLASALRETISSADMPLRRNAGPKAMSSAAPSRRPRRPTRR